jgi:hypothetical protein
MKKAIVSLAVGETHLQQFQECALPSWGEYSKAHGFDLIVFTEALDKSTRALSRSPAWQKCLIPLIPRVQEYDQVVWIDSDIVISPYAPDITEGIPLDHVAAVDEYSILGESVFGDSLKRVYAKWRQDRVAFIDNLTPELFHSNFGLPNSLSRVVQTGVFVFNPSLHAQVLKDVYTKYEDRGANCWNFEMRPLSYELQTRCNVIWLDYRFNLVWPFFKEMVFSEFFTLSGSEIYLQIQRLMAKSALNFSYFLHFAGSANEMKLLKN